MSKHLFTEIRIHATPEKVWAVLTNFDAYPTWNPFITSITGDVRVDNTITVTLARMTFKPKVLAYEPNKEFRWVGHLLCTGIFDGEHKFLLIDNLDGTTTLQQSEIFSGILIPLMKKMIDGNTKHNFELMNKAIKEIAEK